MITFNSLPSTEVYCHAAFTSSMVPFCMKDIVCEQGEAELNGSCGDKDMIVGGDPNSDVVEGLLQKVQ